MGRGTVNLSGSNDKVTLASVTQDRLGSIGKFYLVRHGAALGDDE
jgi:hypothetical protein